MTAINGIGISSKQIISQSYTGKLQGSQFMNEKKDACQQNAQSLPHFGCQEKKNPTLYIFLFKISFSDSVP